MIPMSRRNTLNPQLPPFPRLQLTISPQNYSFGTSYISPAIYNRKISVRKSRKREKTTIMDAGKKGSKGQAKAAEERKDRRSATGMSGEPKKGGHGGKFTWSGDKSYSDEVMVNGAIDARDPNFQD